MSVRVRRGTDAQRLTVVLQDGEIAWTTDTNEFFVGDGVTLGGILIGPGAGGVPLTRNLTINGVTFDLSADRTWSVGTVTSVSLTLPGEFSVAGSPVTGAGGFTATWASQAQNLVFASPNGVPGTPSFRALVATDIPALAYVTSVGLSAPAEFSVSGSPVTGSGTLGFTWVSQLQNLFLASPNGAPGTPTFRAILASDIPALAYVSSVGLSLPAEFTISGSPVTGAGTLTGSWASQLQNLVFASPNGAPGTPTFRALAAADIPALPYISNTLTSAQIIVGNAGNVATAVSMSGDATISNTGVLTVSNNAINFDKLDDEAELAIVVAFLHLTGN